MLLADLAHHVANGAEVFAPGFREISVERGRLAGLLMCLDEIPIDVPGLFLRDLAELVQEIACPLDELGVGGAKGLAVGSFSARAAVEDHPVGLRVAVDQSAAANEGRREEKGDGDFGRIGDGENPAERQQNPSDPVIV